VSSTYISAALRRRVRSRAEGRCEYCLLSDAAAYFRHEPDHIIAEKHGGETTAENLALACFDCNRFKGSDIATLDPESRRLVPLFNPRTQQWDGHLSVVDGRVFPLTSVGRATVQLLRLNLPQRLEVRQILSTIQKYP
jgi:5-methylcytosine-specific restriction endonuclease McrA